MDSIRGIEPGQGRLGVNLHPGRIARDDATSLGLLQPPSLYRRSGKNRAPSPLRSASAPRSAGLLIGLSGPINSAASLGKATSGCSCSGTLIPTALSLESRSRSRGSTTARGQWLRPRRPASPPPCRGRWKPISIWIELAESSTTCDGFDHRLEGIVKTHPIEGRQPKPGSPSVPSVYLQERNVCPSSTNGTGALYGPATTGDDGGADWRQGRRLRENEASPPPKCRVANPGDPASAASSPIPPGHPRGACGGR